MPTILNTNWGLNGYHRKVNGYAPEYAEGFPFEDLVFSKCIDGYKYTLKIDSNVFSSNGEINDIRDRKELDRYITYTSKLIPQEDDLPF